MSLFKKLSAISRRRKMELFEGSFRPTEQTRVLDVGAEIDPDGERALQFIDWYPWKNQICAVNLSAEHVSRIKEVYPEIDAVVGDACQLPWPDNHFDIVYCNAVIEHMGSFNKQGQLASEIIRVGRQWFVATPNRWYPYEFHMRLPLVTWLPGRGYLWVGKVVSYNHVDGRYMSGIRNENLRLMTVRELKVCFPKSKVIKQRVTFMSETLIAIGGKS